MKTLGNRSVERRWLSAYMMRKICIHDNYKIPSNEIQAVNICCPMSLLSHSFNMVYSKAYPKPSLPARDLRTYMFFILGTVQ